MEEEELSAKRFKSNSLDEVLEIFSTFTGPAPPSSSILPVIKQEMEMDEQGRPVEKLEDRYSHILVKETLVDLDDGVNALVGESFGHPSEEACDDANEEGVVVGRSQLLKQLEHLKRNLHRKLVGNAGKYRKLEKQYEDLKSKSGPETDDEWENKSNAVLKSKQDRILVLEREMERKMEESSDCGDDGSISIDNSLFLKLVAFLKDEKERANSIKGILGASVGKLKGVKEKEDQLKTIRVENERLSTSLIDIEAKSRDLLKNIDILSEEVKGKDLKIEMLKETNANLEQEVNLGLVDMDNTKVEGDIAEVMQSRVKEKDQEITNLNKKLSTLTSESLASQTLSNRMKTLLKQTEDELTILKEKQSCHDELLQKYETRLSEKDQEINSLKRQSSLNDLKSEFTMYFNELDRKSQQFMNLVKEQQDEIETLKNQKILWERSQKNPVPLPVSQPRVYNPPPRRFLRPVRSQVPYRLQSPPPQLYNSPNTLASQQVPSDSGVSLFDQAPRYYSGQLAQQPQNRTFQPSQVPGESLLGRTLPQDLAGDMPLLEGPFSFD